MYEPLKAAVADMPLGLATAILRGFDSQPMVAGAFVHDGGACPNLIGRRNGARNAATYLRLADAWDAYCEAARPRFATDRECLVLKSLLRQRVLGAERVIRRETCDRCSRPLHIDYFGACATCGHISYFNHVSNRTEVLADRGEAASEPAVDDGRCGEGGFGTVEAERHVAR